jgi:hypothetical protein
LAAHVMPWGFDFMKVEGWNVKGARLQSLLPMSQKEKDTRDTQLNFILIPD